MNKTQWPRVMHKVVLHTIRRQLLTLAMGMKPLLTLATGIFKKNIENRTIPVVVPTMKPRIDQRITQTVLTPQTLLTPTRKEVNVDAELGSAWINRTPWKVRRTGVGGSTPGNIRNYFSVKDDPSPVLIGIVSTSPPCGLNASLQVIKKGNPFPPAWSGTLKNWTLLLITICPMIWIRRPLLSR